MTTLLMIVTVCMYTPQRTFVSICREQCVCLRSLIGVGAEAALCSCRDPSENYPCNGLCRLPNTKGDGVSDR